MRHPNGYGTIKKLSGKRRKPYAAMITTGYSIEPSTDKIAFLEPILSPELYNQVLEEYAAYVGSQPKGRQIQKAIGYYETKQEALLALADYNKSPYKLDNKAATFEDIYKAILPELSKDSKSKLVGYQQAYRNAAALHKRKIADITAADMQAVIDGKAGSSKTIQRKLLSLFKWIFNYADANNLVNKNYSQYLKYSEIAQAAEKSIFTAEEISLLWDNIDYKTKKTPAQADSFLILLYTGLRVNELLSLNNADVDMEQRLIYVHGTKTAAADRIVPIHKDILPLLQKRLSEHPDALYTNSLGNRVAYAKFSNYFQEYRAQIGITHTIHELRHTFVSMAEAQGMDRVILKKIVGHKTGDITADVYTHIAPEQLIAEMDKMVFK